MDSSDQGVDNNQQKNDVFFDSYNIGRKERTEFFEKEAEQSQQAARSKKLVIIVVAAAAVIIIAAVILMLYLLVWRQPTPEVAAEEEDTPTSVFADEEMERYFNTHEAVLEQFSTSTSENLDTELRAYIIEQLGTPETTEDQFDIDRIRVDFYKSREDYTKALEILQRYNENDLALADQFILYHELVELYTELGYEEEAAEAQVKYDAIAEEGLGG